MEAMRGNGIMDVEDVLVAVLETNGTVSIVAKPEKSPPSASEMKISVKKSGGIPTILIMNGKYIKGNIDKMQASMQQVEKILRVNEVSLKNVFMLTIDENGKTNLIRREDI